MSPRCCCCCCCWWWRCSWPTTTSVHAIHVNVVRYQDWWPTWTLQHQPSHVLTAQYVCQLNSHYYAPPVGRAACCDQSVSLSVCPILLAENGVCKPCKGYVSGYYKTLSGTPVLWPKHSVSTTRSKRFIKKRQHFKTLILSNHHIKVDVLMCLTVISLHQIIFVIFDILLVGFNGCLKSVVFKWKLYLFFYY